MPDPTPMALLRYQAISAYLAMDPPRGKRRATLEHLAGKTWALPDGRQVHFAAETLRTWVRRYRAGGLPALEDKPHPRRGVQILTPEQVALVCRLKREVPERSLDRLLEILHEMELVEPGTVTRSTLHRVLADAGISGRPKPEATTTDLDRFEATAPNQLWQSDLLAGPWLDDPTRPGKKKRAWLYAFLDDHSRHLLYGRFAFKGDLPALELVFRQALRSHGIPGRVYYDNGATYRSRHMRQVVATLGIHGLVFTTPHRPEGHGKIEAFNRLCKAAFIAEVKASKITTLDELNVAFVAWSDRYYNRRPHSEIGEAPRDRWRRGLPRVRHLDEEVLRQAFLWTETRKADKTGLLSLFGRRYQTSSAWAGKSVQLRYDPERLDEIEVWYDGTFRERIGLFEVQPHRRSKRVETAPQPVEPGADWLGHLVATRKGDFVDPADDLQRELRRRREADDGVVLVMRERLHSDVFDEDTVRRWLGRFGPIDAGAVAETLDFALEHMPNNHHTDTYLDLLHALLEGHQ